MKQSYYENQAESTAKTIQQYKKDSQLFTTKRTLAFILLVLTVGAAYDFGNSWILLLAIFIFAYFFYLIKAHSQLHDHLLYEENKLQVINRYLGRFNGDWKKYPDGGEDFMSRNIPQDTDLNILGPNSLFQYCSVARTEAGRKRLSQRLQPDPVAIDEVISRQKETKFFLDHPAESIHLQSLSQPIPLNHSMQKLLDYISDRQGDYPKTFTKVSILLPVLSLAMLILAVIDIIPSELPLLLFSLQLGLALLMLGKNSTHITPLYKLNKELVHYYQLLSALEEILPEKIGQLDPTEIKSSLAPIKKLGLLCMLAELRHNFILLFLLNFLLLWDIHVVNLFINWQKKYGEQLQHWLSIWHETEVSLSLATIGQSRENAIMPLLLNVDTPRIEAEELENILIEEGKSIANSLTLVPSLNVITGSNMSGKTTWLRTLASACILTYAGAPVVAQRFALSPMKILTSIRVNDDLSDGISTFYAELTRLKAMIEETKKGTPILAVIDEIFKGTNSADRIICAQTALIHLAKAKVITLVSTHDFELCHLKPNNEIPVNNYHFQEHYQEDKILFDYKIKNGPCETTNAQYLLKMVGIE